MPHARSRSSAPAGLRPALMLLLLALLLPRGARAQAEAAPPPPPVGVPTYGSVDASTVRVFSVGSVGVETLDVRGREIKVADARSGHGTGFVVGPGGLILTARHVVEGARHVVVRLPGDGGFFGARVVVSREAADVAVLAIDADVAGLEVSPHARLRVRQPVFAIGYPVDPSRTHPQSARGIIAGHLDDGTLQLDMALNPGNSGGPLLDESDRVVGMVVSRGKVDAGIQGIGFAVPATELAAAAAEARGRLGAGQMAPLPPTTQLAAVVVDELIQQGALYQLHRSADLGDGLRRTDLDRALDALISGIDDADLLVIVAATLWNAALALEVGGVRRIGKNTLTDAEALELARRLRASSIETSRRAVRMDASVRQRSAFLDLTLGGPPGAAAASHAAPAGAPREPGGPPPRPKAVYKQWWFWVVVGVGAIIAIDIATSSGSSAGPSARPAAADGRAAPAGGGAVLLRF